MRIEIAGILSSGKTTLTTLLTTKYAILENFKSNPFLSSFYNNTAKYAFETEISFLLQHYHQIKKNSYKHKICDFALIQDLAYAKMGMQGNKQKIFVEIYNEIKKEIGLPDILILLNCDFEILLERIKRRGRKNEDKIDISFLSSLHNYLINEIKEMDIKATTIIHVDTTNINFEDNPVALDVLKKRINIQ